MLYLLLFIISESIIFLVRHSESEDIRETGTKEGSKKVPRKELENQGEENK